MDDTGRTEEKPQDTSGKPAISSTFIAGSSFVLIGSSIKSNVTFRQAFHIEHTAAGIRTPDRPG